MQEYKAYGFRIMYVVFDRKKKLYFSTELLIFNMNSFSLQKVDSEFIDSSLLNTALSMWADTYVLRLYAHTVT